LPPTEYGDLTSSRFSWKVKTPPPRGNISRCTLSKNIKKGGEKKGENVKEKAHKRKRKLKSKGTSNSKWGKLKAKMENEECSVGGRKNVISDG
jgi:hypothetical protein